MGGAYAICGERTARRDLVRKTELKGKFGNPSRKFGRRWDVMKRDIQEMGWVDWFRITNGTLL